MTVHFRGGLPGGGTGGFPGIRRPARRTVFSTVRARWKAPHIMRRMVIFKERQVLKMPNMPKRRPADAGNAGHMGEVGILTFHCSDNFGAMLQAYGLKRFLREHGVRADIVRYAPFYMTGRHWWLPYWPASGWRGWVRP